MSEQAFSTSALSDDLLDGLQPTDPAGGPAASGAHGATPMAKKISGSVGKGGKNKPESPTDDGAEETYMQSLSDGGEGLMAKPAPDAPMFDMPGEKPAIAILVGLLLPAIQAARDDNPAMPSTPVNPPVDKDIDLPADSEREEDASTGSSGFGLSAGETFEAVDDFSFNFAEIKHRSKVIDHPADSEQEEDAATGFSDFDLSAGETFMAVDQISLNFEEIKHRSHATEAADPDSLHVPVDGAQPDPALEQIIAESTRTYGDKDKPNDLLIGGDGIDVLSDTPWSDPVDDVLV